MSHIGPEVASGDPLEEEHCAVTLVESRLSLAVSATAVYAAADEVKISLTDCVDEVKRSVIHVCLGGQGELQCEISVEGSAGQVLRLAISGTEPILEENNSVLEVRGFTLTIL